MLRLLVAARKGGVGKSSLTAGLSSLFAHQGRRVLAVDLDPQSNLAYMLGAPTSADGTAALLRGERPVPQVASERLHVLPGGPALSAAEVVVLPPERLAAGLEAYADHYDVMIYDAPPGHPHLERFGVAAADAAVVVTNAHPIALLGARRVLLDFDARRAAGLPTPTRAALALNAFDARRTMDRDARAMLAELPRDVPRVEVPQDAAFAQCTAAGVPPAEGAPNCRALTALAQLVRWCDGDL